MDLFKLFFIMVEWVIEIQNTNLGFYLEVSFMTAYMGNLNANLGDYFDGICG
jgi:hypothetical protein